MGRETEEERDERMARQALPWAELVAKEKEARDLARIMRSEDNEEAGDHFDRQARLLSGEQKRRRSELAELPWDSLADLAQQGTEEGGDLRLAAAALSEMRKRGEAAKGGDYTQVLSRLERAAARAAEDAQAMHTRARRDKAGQDVLVEARALSTELQPHTVLALGLEPDRPEQDEESDGGTYGLRNPNACAVIRLYRAGDIDEAGLAAARKFGRLGDLIFRPARIRTSRYDDAGGPCHANDDGDEEERLQREFDARAAWQEACAAIGDRGIVMLEGVMRLGMSSSGLAAQLFPRITDTRTLQGRGDQILIYSCELLVDLWKMRKRGTGT